MRVLVRIRQSRGRIAAAVSATLLAVLAAGIGLAPAASASTTGTRSATQTASTVRPDEQVLYFGGIYPTLHDCDASLAEVETNPNFVDGWCSFVSGYGYAMYYVLEEPFCGGTPATLAGVPAARAAIIAERLAGPAC